MTMDTLKRFWPKFFAGSAREWVLQRVGAGQMLGGKFKVNLPAGELAKIEAGADAPDGAIDVDLDFTGLSIAYMDDLPAVLAGDAKLTIKGTEFSVDIPQGKLVEPSTGREIALSDGRFYVPDLRPDPLQGVVSFKAAGATPTVLALLDGERLGYLKTVGLKPDFLGGTASGGFTLTMPLSESLVFKDVKFRGMARLDQAIAANLIGGMDVEGGSLDVNLTEEAVEAKGIIQIKGVPAELVWQRIFDAPNDHQPPIRVTANLDEEAREKLGFKVNHLVKGTTPVTLSVTGLGEASPNMSLNADLTDAQLLFGGMGWTKPAGRRANIQFDVAQKDDGTTELQNLKILGDDINIEGSVALDSEQRLKSFYFSDFSIDSSPMSRSRPLCATTRCWRSGRRGRAMTASSSSNRCSRPASSPTTASEPADPFGVDLAADIDTVVGFYDTTARTCMSPSRSATDGIVALDGKGRLNGRTPATVDSRTSGGSRVIKVESRDAGSAFRLVGFYPSVEGGNAQLQVNLDAGAKGSISGTLWAHDFTVKGDSVVGDVLTDPSSEAVLGERKQQRTAGTRIAFTQLRAPFPVGGGKFRLRDAYMNGAAARRHHARHGRFQVARRSSSAAPTSRSTASTPRSGRSPFSARCSSAGRARGWSASPSPSRASSTIRRCWSIRCR